MIESYVCIATDGPHGAIAHPARPAVASPSRASIHETDCPSGRSRPRSHRNPRVAGLARLRPQGPGRAARRAAAARARDPRAPQRRQAAVHGQHALRQHHRRRRADAGSRQQRDRAPHQEPRPLERHGDGGQGQPRLATASAATSRPTPRRRRSTRSASTTSSAARTTSRAATSSTSRATPRRACTRARSSKGRLSTAAARELPPRAEAGRRPVVVPAPVADARVLGGADGLDGPRADHVDLPGALLPLPRGSRPQAQDRPEGVGVPRRRRDRRARVARRDHAGVAREARQPDLRHQLQPAAARRPGARQRPDHPGARGGLPRRRLERHQGAVGPRVGRAAREGSRRPADASAWARSSTASTRSTR